MATPIPSQRSTIYQEDVAYKRAVSNAILGKVGAVINYIIDKIYYSERFDCNGFFRGSTSVSVGGMGTCYINRDSKIVGWSMSVGYSGDGDDRGTDDNEVNFTVYDETGASLGNLFTTTPKISAIGVSNISMFREYDSAGNVTESTASHGSGRTFGVINPTFLDLPKNYKLRSNITGNQLNAQDLSFTIFLAAQE